MDTASGIAPKRVGRPRSEVRSKHFHQVSVNNHTKWQCNYCQLQYAEKTGSANFTRHMLNNHGALLEPQPEEYNDKMVNMGYTGSPGSASDQSEQSSPCNMRSPDYIPQSVSNTYRRSLTQPLLEPGTPFESTFQVGQPYHTVAEQRVPMGQLTNLPYPMTPMPQNAHTQLMANYPPNPSTVFSSHPTVPLLQTIHHPQFGATLPQQQQQQQQTQGQLQGFQHPQLYQMPIQTTEPVAVMANTAGVFADPSCYRREMLQDTSLDQTGPTPNNAAQNDILQFSFDASFGFMDVGVDNAATSEAQVSTAQECKPNDFLIELPLVKLDDEQLSFESGNRPIETPGPQIPSKTWQTENTWENVLPMDMEHTTISSSNDSQPGTVSPNQPIMHQQPEKDRRKVARSNDVEDCLQKASQDDTWGQIVPYSSMEGNGPRGIKRLVCIENLSSEDLESLVEQLHRSNYTDMEIQDKILRMSVSNPVYLEAFLNDEMDSFFNLAHSKFPRIRLGLNSLNSELLGRNLDRLRDTLKDQCDRKWSPLLFDVFILPLKLGDATYASIELVFLDKKGNRQSCLLDCQQIPDNCQELVGLILQSLREFEVDNVVSSVSVKGNELGNLGEQLRKHLQCTNKRHQRTLAFGEDEQKKSAYFSVLKKSHRDQVDSILLEGGLCLSNLVQTEHILQKYLSKDVSEGGEFLPTVEIRRTCSQKFRVLDRKLEQLSRVGMAMQAKLRKVIGDTENKRAIYYVPSSQDPINLMHIIPIEQYKGALADVRSHLETLLQLLENPEMAAFDMSDLEDGLLLIEVDESPKEDEKRYELERLPGLFRKWKRIVEQSATLSNKYLGLCNHLKSDNLSARSLYREDFREVAQMAPQTVQPHKWKKVVLLRAWGKFESNYYS